MCVRVVPVLARMLKLGSYSVQSLTFSFGHCRRHNSLFILNLLLKLTAWLLIPEDLCRRILTFRNRTSRKKELRSVSQTYFAGIF